MLNKIKSHWHKLKTEYENRYNKSFLKDFETSTYKGDEHYGCKKNSKGNL